MAMAVLTILAILLGPVVGVWIGIQLQQRRAKEERRFDVFRTLMRTRRNNLSPDHVGALNLVEIEFRDDPEVISKFKDLFDHFVEPHPRLPTEEVRDGMEPAKRRERNERYDQRIQQARQELLTALLSKLASAVGFKDIEQLDIFKGGYTPQGWGDTELQQEAIRRLFTDIYLGRMVFPVGVVNLHDQSTSTPTDITPEQD